MSRFLVHKDFKDVFVEVLKGPYQGTNYRRLKVRWWNEGSGTKNSQFDIGITETITILNKDWSNWKSYNPQWDTHPGRVEFETERD